MEISAEADPETVAPPRPEETLPEEPLFPPPVFPFVLPAFPLFLGFLFFGFDFADPDSRICKVFAPAIPSAVRPFVLWKESTASFVSSPK